MVSEKMNLQKIMLLQFISPAAGIISNTLFSPTCSKAWHYLFQILLKTCFMVFYAQSDVQCQWQRVKWMGEGRGRFKIVALTSYCHNT